MHEASEEEEMAARYERQLELNAAALPPLAGSLVA